MNKLSEVMINPISNTKFVHVDLVSL